jgi:hypothetical protein
MENIMDVIDLIIGFYIVAGIVSWVWIIVQAFNRR